MFSNSPAAFSTSFFYNEFTDITAMGSFGGFRGAINVVGNRFVGSYFYERDNTIHLNFLRQGIYAAGTSYTDVGENDIFLNDQVGNVVEHDKDAMILTLWLTKFMEIITHCLFHG